jgi:hypothetical protein
MYDWLVANWIWILLGIGVLWFMFRRGGMGAHGGQGGSEPAEKALPPSGTDSSADHAEQGQEPAAAARGAHRHGGCC